MKAFEKLLAWQTCHKLVLMVYQVTGRWPDKERFGPHLGLYAHVSKNP